MIKMIKMMKKKIIKKKDSFIIAFGRYQPLFLSHLWQAGLTKGMTVKKYY
jgi:hypothetical protein